MLKDETALVTGASRGIGRCMAENLAQQGVHLALVAHPNDDLTDTLAACQAHGVQAHALPYNLTEIEGLGGLAAAAAERLGGSISFLLNIAGIWRGGPFETANLVEWDRAFDVNLRALMLLTHHTLPFILQAKQRAVINIASLSGVMPHPGAGIYCATKHAVIAFTRSLFEDVHMQGVKVCAICPGFVETDMTSNMGSDRSMIMAPQDVVNAILYVLTQSPRVCPVEILLRSQFLEGTRA